MSAKEVDRLEVIRRVLERRLKRVKAAQVLGVTTRQVRRLCDSYQREGAAALVSKRRGQPSNHRLSEDLQRRAVALVRDLYGDFGPTLAREKLIELHGIRVAKETLRKWMAAADIWLPRDRRVPKPHQPRYRRSCLGELVQIDGCDHPWFEERGPACALLVYVDDATGRLMELRFVKTESAFGYFDATASYLRRHGKPVAFYSDKHSIFRVAQEGTTGRDRGVTQFGRALGQLNIDIICANTPQAKGRVERMNSTLQDRLVKELRLRAISAVETGNAFAPTFIEDFNRRFAKPPRNPHDAHRPVVEQALDSVFSWQEERTMSRNLVVHYRRVSYLIEPTKEALKLGGRKVSVHEWHDGRVEIRYGGVTLAYSTVDSEPHVSPGDVVENKRLGAVLATIQAAQTKRDEARLASRKMTVVQKDRLRARLQRLREGAPALEAAGKPRRDRPLTVSQPTRITLASVDPNGPVQTFLDRFAADQAEKHRRYSVPGNQRKREREFAAAATRSARPRTSETT